MCCLSVVCVAAAIMYFNPLPFLNTRSGTVGTDDGELLLSIHSLSGGAKVKLWGWFLSETKFKLFGNIASLKLW